MDARSRRLARRPAPGTITRPSRWVREWVTLDLVAGGGKVRIQKWVREDKLEAIRENNNARKNNSIDNEKTEPTTEILFLCNHAGCGRTFIDAIALRKHAHIHGEKHHVCSVLGCGKKFPDSSKLKRHNLTHTGEKNFVCHHEGCGKAFSLEFNLRSHLKTHSQENYNICPYGDCCKRFAHAHKLQAHIEARHKKGMGVNAAKQTPPRKLQNTPKTSAAGYGFSSLDRPYVCPFEGCDKAYIHQYKLNLHLREYPHHMEENGNRAAANDREIDEAGDAYLTKNEFRYPYGGNGKSYIHEHRLSPHMKREHPGHNSEEIGKHVLPFDNDIDDARDNVAPSGRNSFVCPYQGCNRMYVHEYRLNHHLRKEHPVQNLAHTNSPLALNYEDVEDNQYGDYVEMKMASGSLKRSKPGSVVKTPVREISKRSSALTHTNQNIEKKIQPSKEALIFAVDREKMKDENHEDCEDDGWRYQGIDENNDS